MARLMRAALQDSGPERWDHAGLLLDRGLGALDREAGARGEAIGRHIERVCAIQPPEEYRSAYARWERVSDDAHRFARWFGRVEGRLFVGLGMAHVLEYQITRNRIYGMPLIPGSALKGVARRGALRLGLEQDACEVLFGRDGDRPEDFASGYLVFHDAWWVPGSAPTPYTPEIVTVHHQDYYGSQGEMDPTPFDAPNPNHQIAARGSFLFVVEGPACWAQIGLDALKEALVTDGVGGKAAAGYGFFAAEEDVKAAERCRRRMEKAQEAAQAREAARRQAAEEQRKDQEERARLAAMSEEERQVHALDKELDAAREKKDAGLLSEEDKAALHRAIKDLFERAPAWPEPARLAAAQWIEDAYDLLGWRTKKGKKGKEEEQKKRRRIEALRQGRKG